MDLEQVCKQVIALTKTVGTYIEGERKNFSQNKVEEKSLNNFVSYVDKTAEEKLVEGLKALVPEAGFIVEEGTETKKGETYNWIVDPLDGTTNFIHDFPFYAISIALMQDNEIVLGVIYEIPKKECFYSWKGAKAFLNDQEIKVSDAITIKESLVGTGFPYHDYNRLEQYLELFKWFMENSHGVRRPGSAATDLAYVACGRFDGFFEYGLSPWDVAAGAFLIQQAGGKVSDFKGGGDYIFGKEIVAGNANNYRELHEVIDRFMN